MALDALFNYITAIEDFDIVEETIKIINRNDDTILQLVRGQMSTKGTRGDGEKINAKYGPFYADRTVFNKRISGSGVLGKQTEFVTMFMHGHFYASLFLVTNGATFEVMSTDPVFEKLNIVWNKNKLVELDAVSLAYFQQEILIPQLQAAFMAKIS